MKSEKPIALRKGTFFSNNDCLNEKKKKERKKKKKKKQTKKKKEEAEEMPLGWGEKNRKSDLMTLGGIARLNDPHDCELNE